MGRAPRIDRPGGWHHVMNRGVARQKTFFDDVDRIEFGRLLGVGHGRFGVEVHAYCLMPNHFHLLLRCPDGGLSEFMQQLGSVFTRHTNERVGRDGPLFRGRFHSISVDTPEYLLSAVRYVHRNPLALGVERLDRYRWSSHRTYLGLRQRPSWFRSAEVLSYFGRDRRAFGEFVTGARRDGMTAVAAGRLPAVIELVVDEIDDLLDRRRQGLVRTVGLLVLEQLDGAAADRFARWFEFPSRRARQQAMWRARRQAASDPLLIEAAQRSLDLAA